MAGLPFAIRAEEAGATDYPSGVIVAPGNSLLLTGGDTVTKTSGGGAAVEIRSNTSLTLQAGATPVTITSDTNVHGIWSNTTGSIFGSPPPGNTITFGPGVVTNIATGGTNLPAATTDGILLTAGSKTSVTFDTDSITNIDAYLGMNLGPASSSFPAAINTVTLRDGAVVNINASQRTGSQTRFQGISMSGGASLHLDEGSSLAVDIAAGGSGLNHGIIVSQGTVGGGVFTSDAGANVSITSQSGGGLSPYLSNALQVILGGSVNLQGNTTISTLADQNRGVFLWGSAGFEGLVIDNQSGGRSTITTSGVMSDGIAIYEGDARIGNTDVITEGQDSSGVLVLGANSTFTSRTSTVTTEGTGGHGVVIVKGASATGTDTDIHANAAGAIGLLLVGDTTQQTASFTGGSIISSQGTAIAVGGGTGVVTLDGVTVSGTPNWLEVAGSQTFGTFSALAIDLEGTDDNGNPVVLQQASAPGVTAGTPSTANITATNSTLTGAATTEAGSISNVTLIDSLWTMTGSSNLTNLLNDPSLIQYTPPVGDPGQLASYKSLTVVNYIGEGGGIGLNTYLGDDTAPSDRLIIDGGAGIGTSMLFIANTTGPGALTLADGILVVDAQAAATTVPGAFTLGNRVAAGAFEYSLYRGGASNAESWFLRSRLIPTPPTPDPDLPDYRNEVPVDTALPALASRLGLGMLGTYHDRVGEEYPDPAQPAEPIFCKDASKNYRCVPTPEQAAVYADAQAQRRQAGWGRFFGESGQVDFKAADPAAAVSGIENHGPSYDFNMYGLQAGMDLLRRLNEDGSRDVAGLYVAAGRNSADVQAVLGGPAGTAALNGYSLGGYWTHIGEKGWYVDAVVQGTYYDAEGAAAGRVPFAGETFDTDGWGFVASVEGGYPIALGNGWAVEPQAQLVYQHVALDDGSDSFGRIGFDASDALYGRLGARLAKAWMTQSGKRMSAWGHADVWSGFGSQAETTFSGLAGGNPVTFNTDIGETWGSVGLGLAGELTETVSLFGSGDYNFGLGGDFDSWSGRIGMKVKW